jgi:hypothetical protein
MGGTEIKDGLEPIMTALIALDLVLLDTFCRFKVIDSYQEVESLNTDNSNQSGWSLLAPVERNSKDEFPSLRLERRAQGLSLRTHRIESP